MISTTHNCLFVHIPKAAGQSVESLFLALHGVDWSRRSMLKLGFNPNPKLGPPRLAHLTAREYISCGHLTESQFERMFKFTIVRNPWDRVVSEYEYRRLSARLSFKDFLLKHFPCPGRTDAYRHVLPQNEFILDSDGRLMVDFVARFERLEEDFRFVSQRLSLAPQMASLPHVNKSRNRRHYREYYDEESREFVEHFYLRDVELLEYSF